MKALLGLVELYIQTGQPVGSNTLRERGFEDLSSATLRNYFSLLEAKGYLRQQHASGGRIPTPAAYRYYAAENLEEGVVEEEFAQAFLSLKKEEEKDIAGYLQRTAEQLSSLLNVAVFFSSPRFDHDTIQKIRLILLETRRFLCVLLTEFGLVHTEIFHTENDLDEESILRMEQYFAWRLWGGAEPLKMSEEEELTAREVYNEIMVRYIVSYANFSHEDIYRTGFSQLLKYPDYNEISSLASGLSLFESRQGMRQLLRECTKANGLKVWIGEELAPHTSDASPDCTVIAIPYRIQQRAVGSIGLLGPMRIPYKKLFGALRVCTDVISEKLTRAIYRFKMSYRNPQDMEKTVQNENKLLLEAPKPIILDNPKRKRGKK